MTDPVHLAQFSHQAGKIGERLYAPASLLVLLFGIGLMTNDQSSWDWDMTFVQIALAGWALTFITGFFWIRPNVAAQQGHRGTGTDGSGGTGAHQAHPARDTHRHHHPPRHRLRHDGEAPALS